MKTIVVVGNPKPKSRTMDAAEKLSWSLGYDVTDFVDVIDLGAGLLAWGDPGVRAAVELVADADLAIFASPTFKATYSGVLKLFLDQFAGSTGLEGVVAIPLMLGASPGHALTAELTLKPVLVELGAICPTPAVYQLDSTYLADPALPSWVSQWSGTITSMLTNKPGR